MQNAPVNLQRQQKPAGQPYGAQAGGQPGQYGAPQGGQPYGAAPTPGQYGAPGAMPGAPQGGMPGAYGAPQAAQPYGAPQTAQPYGAPQGGMPGAQPYGAAPQPGQYGAPQGGMPGAVPQQGQYGAPQQSQYGAPQGQYGQPQMGQPAMGQPPMGGQQYGQQPVMGAPAAQMPTQMGAPGSVISLVKGQNMSLTKVAPGLRHARIGLGWDVRQSPGAPFDLDSSVFLLTSTGKVRGPQDLIFYNNKTSQDGSIVHQGDNLTGAGEGDDEQLIIDLTRVPQDVQRIVITCSIYDAETRGQNFGMVQRAFVRIVDQDTNQEIVRYDLTEEACMLNTMVFGELYRYGAEWKFKAAGAPVQGGLRGLSQSFGLAVA